MKILLISFIWPEPTSSAAGFRTMQLIQACQGAGHDVRVFSPAQPNDFQTQLSASGIVTEQYEPNDSRFDSAVKAFNPDVVIFDRFMIEEQFSWRVREQCPNTVRVLDTVDLHSLRRARQRKVEKGGDPLLLSDSELQSEDALREISSIYRSDLSLVLSDFELGFLQSHYRIPAELLQLCRFWYTELSNPKPYAEREHFVSIGNFNHPPNLDSVRTLHKIIWPTLRKTLKAELHIYGAYPTKEILSMDDPTSGFRVKGWTLEARKTLSNYRINLAPLRFGAGIKGKVSDGWSVGTPCVATSIAAEGMHEGLDFGGLIENEWGSFAGKAAQLYSSQADWEKAQADGLRIIRELFSSETISKKFVSSIEEAVTHRAKRRLHNTVGAMLWHHQNRSTEFFSRWIEAKNAKREPSYSH